MSKHRTDTCVLDLIHALAQSDGHEGQASNLQAISLGSHAAVVADVLATQSAQIILGLDDAQSLEIVQQGIIYIDIVFGGVGIGWVSHAII